MNVQEVPLPHENEVACPPSKICSDQGVKLMSLLNDAVKVTDPPGSTDVGLALKPVMQVPSLVQPGVGVAVADGVHVGVLVMVGKGVEETVGYGVLVGVGESVPEARTWTAATMKFPVVRSSSHTSSTLPTRRHTVPRQSNRVATR
jgi:hypothetical protein